MKVKTSITLSEDLVEGLDALLGEFKNRSDAIEQAVRSFLERRAKAMREKRDLKILNARSGRLNEEAEEVLSYQADL